MIVTCIANIGAALSAKYLAEGNTESSIFDVAIGREYPVFAMALWKDQILLLLSDELSFPNWYPIELFSVKDPRLPADWVFGAYRTHDH